VIRNECAKVQDLLPERSLGLLSESEAKRVDVHVAGCVECAAEMALVGSLAMARVEPPAHLLARVQDAVRRAPRVSSVPAWKRWLAALIDVSVPTVPRSAFALASAAMVVLALGTSVLLQQQPRLDPMVGQPASQPAASEASAEELVATYFEGASGFVSEDETVAGAPVLGDLSDFSDEQLAMLLEELVP
jgi:hypothetical protein